jgi:hypothetical protein
MKNNNKKKTTPTTKSMFFYISFVETVLTFFSFVSGLGSTTDVSRGVILIDQQNVKEPSVIVITLLFINEF